MSEELSTEVAAHETGFAAAGWTPERRQRQREAALRLISEGRMGGPEFGKLGGAPKSKAFQRKKLMQEFLAEQARENSKLVNDAILSMIRSEDKRIKVEGVKLYMAAEEFVKRHEREDEREILKLSGSSLDDALRDAFSEIAGVDLFAALEEGVVDAEVVEDEDSSGDDD